MKFHLLTLLAAEEFPELEEHELVLTINLSSHSSVNLTLLSVIPPHLHLVSRFLNPRNPQSGVSHFKCYVVIRGFTQF